MALTQHDREIIENTKNSAEKKIWVTFSREGIHCYPDALQNPKLATNDEYDVSFLGYPHRHQFHFKVWITITHNDREIEFIQFKRYLEKLYDQGTLNLNSKSCEMIADDLYDKIYEKYPEREVWIEVSEDKENGCFNKYF